MMSKKIKTEGEKAFVKTTDYLVKKRDMNNKTSFSKRISFLNARMTSTLSVSLVLFILGIMVLMGVLATNLSRHVKENIGFSIVLNESAGERQVHQLQRMLERAEYVKATQYISKEDALKEVMIELGENPEEVLGVNPLQSSIEVKLRADYANTEFFARKFLLVSIQRQRLGSNTFVRHFFQLLFGFMVV